MRQYPAAGPGRPRRSPMSALRPVAVFYEHPRWFEPLFAELERREVPVFRLDAAEHSFSPQDLGGAEAASLVFNRMSPSAGNRGRGDCIHYTLQYLAHLERRGVRVINGTRAFEYEISKVRQLSLLEALGLPYPRARVIHRPEQAPAAAEGLRFPVAVKPNVGGSGVGVIRFDTPDALQEGVLTGRIDLGLDRTGLVQEFIPARGGHITRVECLNGRFLYAIRVFLSGASFNLCPADLCDEPSAPGATCPVERPSGLPVEAYTPPEEVRAQVLRILDAAGIEIGGIEYVVDDRDGRLYYYDINALSNFVADAPHVLGFNPFENLAAWLAEEAARA